MFEFKLYKSTNKAESITLKAYTDRDCTIFPMLVIEKENIDAVHIVKTRYIVQRANHGMPGYYCRKVDICKDGSAESDRYMASYLPGDWEGDDECVNLKDIPEAAAKKIIRSYVLITLANLFSWNNWLFRERTYTGEHLPDGLRDAIKQFVELDYELLMAH